MGVLFGVFAVLGFAVEGGLFGGWFGDVRKAWMWLLISVSLFVVAMVLMLV